MGNLRTLFITTTLVFGLVLTAAPPMAGQKKNAPRDTPVSSLFADAVDDTITSDGGGAYVTFTNGKGKNADTVENIIQTSNTCCNDWILSTLGSTSRGIWIDLSHPVAGNPFPAPFAAEVRPTRFLNGGINVGPPDFPDMVLGQVIDRRLTVRIANDAQSFYYLLFNTVNRPGTTHVRVTCEDTDTAGCSEWTVDTGLDSSGIAIGRLVLEDSGQHVELGDYYMKFSVRIVKQ